MNRYMMIRRLRWPMTLVLTGVLALLSQMHILGFGHSWPLYLILWGVLALAERAAINEDDVQQMYAGQYPPPYQAPYQAGYQAAPEAQPQPPAPVAETSIVPAHGDEIQHRGSGFGSGHDSGSEGGQS
jgi:hypothetical protein